MKRGEWHDQARELAAADPTRSYASIAREIGVTASAVRKVMDPEKAREYRRSDNAKRVEAKREWSDAHRATCARCGGTCGAGTAKADGSRDARRKASPLCSTCLADVRVERALTMMKLRRERGLSNAAIALRLNLSPLTVRQELSNLRALGFDVPRESSRGRPLVRQRILTPDVRGLGRALRERGVAVPIDNGAVAA